MTTVRHSTKVIRSNKGLVTTTATFLFISFNLYVIRSHFHYTQIEAQEIIKINF